MLKLHDTTKIVVRKNIKQTKEKLMQWFLDNLKAFFETISGWVWGPVMLVLLVGTGILLTVMLKGLQFTMLGYALKQAFVPSKKHEDGEDHEGDISHYFGCG